MTFAQVIQRYQLGDITERELESEIDRVISESPSNVYEMVAEMERVSAALHVPPEILEQVRNRIAANTGYPISAPVDERTRLSDQSPLSTPQSDFAQTGSVPGAGLQKQYSEPLKVGDILGGRFRLKAIIGRGGMSKVFLAEDLQAYGTPEVALKVLDESFSSHPDALISLKRETAKAQQLAHPNIVNVRDFGVDGPYIYMWMEYLEVGSLYDELKKSGGRGLSSSTALSILKDACAALEYAHKRQIVHADLKPGNLMLTRQGAEGLQAKIIDFGIARTARSIEQHGGEMTIYDPGKLRALTLPYASPEMQAGMEPDPRDDIYALGCITYEMFTGKHPFDRIAAEQAKARNLEVTDHPSLNKHQLRAIRRAVAFERDSRTPGASEFLSEFATTAKPRKPLPWKQIGWVTAGIALVSAISAFVVLFEPFKVDPYAPGNIFTDCPNCPSMVVVPSGTFTQGRSGPANAEFANQKPVRQVTFAHPFAVGTTEVTVGQFREFAASGGGAAAACAGYGEGGWATSQNLDWTNPGFGQTDDHPVTCVSWNDATAYANWLSEKTGATYRLPSASEWEYAASASTSSSMAEESRICEFANVADASAEQRFPAWETTNCSDGELFTAPTASYSANAFGMHDALGNVFEWVLDCWNPDYDGAPIEGQPWLTGDCGQRELRGGSWYTRPELVDYSFRNRLPVETRTTSIGFRVVRDLSEEIEEEDGP